MCRYRHKGDNDDDDDDDDDNNNNNNNLLPFCLIIEPNLEFLMCVDTDIKETMMMMMMIIIIIIIICYRFVLL